jgi:hypothetical protein
MDITENEMTEIHLTRDQKNLLKKYILQSMEMRHSTPQTVEFLRRELKVHYAYSTVANLRSTLRNDAKEELDNLRSTVGVL